MPDPVETFRITIQTLTPLHVGDGRRLRTKEFAFLRESNQVLIVMENRLYKRLAKDPNLTNRFMQFCHDPKTKLSDFLENSTLHPEDIGYQLRAISAPGRELQTFISQINGQPYLPGSSLKGAVRSALLRAKLLEDSHHREAAEADLERELPKMERELDQAGGGWKVAKIQERWAKRISENLEHKFFGPDQHTDWLRSLTFSDSASLPRESMLVAPVKVLSTSGDQIRVKLTPNGDREMIVSAQVLPGGKLLEARLGLNRYLLTGVAAEKLDFPAGRLSIEALAAACNRSAQAHIAKEIDFFKRYNVPVMEERYRQLDATLQRLQTNQFLLHLGWGSTFDPKAVTMLLKPALADRMRIAFDLGREKCPFPKSRKVVCNQQGLPVLPLGWLLVTVAG